MAAEDHPLILGSCIAHTSKQSRHEDKLYSQLHEQHPILTQFHFFVCPILPAQQHMAANLSCTLFVKE